MTYTSQKAFFQERPKGKNGDSLIVIYRTDTAIPETPEYSAGAIPAGWSTNFPSSVEQNKWVYMSQRMSNETSWSTPIQISAHDGGPGADGSDIEYIYYRSENPVVSWDGKGPNLEEGAYNFKYTTDLKNGWTDSPQGVREDYKYEYVSVATKPAGMETMWSDFSSPVIWSKWGEKGQNGDGVVYKYCLMTTQTTPTYPTPSGESYTWTDNPSGVSESYPYEYVVAYSTSVVVINAKKIKTAQRSFPFEGEGSWKQYGTVGHEENWTIRNGGDVSMDLDNSHIAIGDYAFIEGVINNSQDPNGQNGTPVKLYGKVIGLKNSSQNEGFIRMETKYLQIGAEPASQVALWAVWSKIQDFSISASSYFLVKEKADSSGYKNSVTLTAKPINITGEYQWYKYDIQIDNETGQSYEVTKPGKYKCKLTETGSEKIWEDEIEIVETIDGAEGKDAIAITLSNPNMIFHENQSSEETETCEVLAMEGTASLTPQISHIGGLPSGVVVQDPKITVSKQSENGSFTFTVTIDVKGGTESITKEFTIYWKYVRDGIDGTSSLNLASDEYIDKYGDGVTLGRNYPYYTITTNSNDFGILEICRSGKNFFETNKTYTISYKIQGIEGDTISYASGYIGNFQFIRGTVNGQSVENSGVNKKYEMALPVSATGIYQISIQLKCIDAGDSRPGVYIQPLRNSPTTSSNNVFKVWDIIVTEGAKEIAWAPANADLEKWVNTFDLTAKSLAIYNKDLDQMNGVSWNDVILLAGKTIENCEVKDANAVYLAGWNVTSNALWHDGTVNDGQGSFDNIGKQNTFGIYPKGLEASELKGGFKHSITSDDAWVLTAGDSFGITKKGAVYASSGKLGGFTLTENSISYANQNGEQTALQITPKGPVLLSSRIISDKIETEQLIVPRIDFEDQITTSGHVFLDSNGLSFAFYDSAVGNKEIIKVVGLEESNLKFKFTITNYTFHFLAGTIDVDISYEQISGRPPLRPITLDLYFRAKSNSYSIYKVTIDEDVKSGKLSYHWFLNSDIGFPASESFDRVTFKNDTSIYKTSQIEQKSGTVIATSFSIMPFITTATLGSNKYIWDEIYVKTVYRQKTNDLSDERLKNHIIPISDEYDNIFDQLQAISYEWNDEKGFSHFGLSAQHTRQLLVSNSIPINEFGGYWEGEDTSEPGTMGIRYTELVPLCIAQIQKLKKRVKELEEKLTSS